MLFWSVEAAMGARASRTHSWPQAINAACGRAGAGGDARAPMKAGIRAFLVGTGTGFAGTTRAELDLICAIELSKQTFILPSGI